MQYTVLRNIKPGLENWLEVLGTVVCFVGVVIGSMGTLLADIKTQCSKIMNRSRYHVNHLEN